MAIEPPPNTGSASTRFEWRRVKIAPARRAPHQNGRKASSRLSLARWKPADRLTITVTYRGGAEAWYELRARGGVLRVPGHRQIHDVMQDIYDGNLYPTERPVTPPG